MKAPPKDWSRLSTALFYQDANAAIEWLREAFDFEVRLKVDGDGGRVVHSELVYGGAVIMVGDEDAQPAGQRPFASPKSLGGKSTQAATFYIDDVDAHCARARAAGARITIEPKVSDYGADYWTDKTYQAADPEGHLWWFCERLRG
ncbi:MAG TPA: VOC family protein [Kofleriaceae bacterium]|nr:VOC family protein [Kofleriaceae bacterium]